MRRHSRQDNTTHGQCWVLVAMCAACRYIVEIGSRMSGYDVAIFPLHWEQAILDIVKKMCCTPVRS